MAAHPKVLAIVLAGGEGKRLMPLTADRAKPAVPFGGTYRLIDFVLSNLVNAGHAADRGADPVQVALARPAHLADLADVDPARQLRHPGAGPAAARPAVVPGQRRRDLPVDEPDQRRATPTTSSSSAPTTSTGWTSRRCWTPTSTAGWACTVAGIRVPRSQASAFGVIDAGDGRQDRRSSWRSRPTRPGLPDDPEASFASMGNYIFTTDALIDALRRRRRERDLPARHGRRHHPQLRRPGRGARSTTSRANVVPGIDRPGPGLLARRRDASTPTTRRTWTWSRSTRSSTSTTATGRSGPTRCRCPAPSSPCDGLAPDSIVSPGCIVSGGVDRRLGARHRTSGCWRTPRSTSRCCLSNVWIGRNAVVRRAILDKNVRGRGRRADRRRPRGRPGPRLHRLRRRHHHRRQGRRRHEGVSRFLAARARAASVGKARPASGGAMSEHAFVREE